MPFRIHLHGALRPSRAKGLGHMHSALFHVPVPCRRPSQGARRERTDSGVRESRILRPRRARAQHHQLTAHGRTAMDGVSTANEIKNSVPGLCRLTSTVAFSCLAKALMSRMPRPVLVVSSMPGGSPTPLSHTDKVIAPSSRDTFTQARQSPPG